MKKRRLSTIILILLFLAGLSLLLYPTVSNYWNSLHQTEAIAEYTGQVEDLDSDRCEQLWAEAESYNQSLRQKEDRYHLSEKEQEEYMISYVKGPLMAIEEDVIVVEAGHVGLAIHVPVSLLPELPGMGKEVTVYTYFQVREDAMTLYGFLHSQDRDMFRQLLGVNGIGPKGAL